MSPIMRPSAIPQRHATSAHRTSAIKREVKKAIYVKKGVSRITSRRVPIGGYWNNIGPPVVSYYTNEELRDMVVADRRVREVVFEADEAHVPQLVRRVMRKTNTTLIVETL